MGFFDSDTWSNGSSGALDVAQGWGESAIAPFKGPNTIPHKQAIIYQLNELVVSAIVNSLRTCCSTIRADQSLTVSCQPSDTFGFPYEANDACTTCMQSVFKVEREFLLMEQREWDIDRPDEIRVRTPPEVWAARLNQRLHACGLGHCKACVLNNVHQRAILKQNQSCLSSLEINNNVQTKYEQLLSHFFHQNEAVLKGAMAYLGIKDQNKIQQIMSSKIRQSVVTNTLTNVKSLLTRTQTLQVRAGQAVLNGVTQDSVATLLSSTMLQEKVVNSMYSDRFFDIIQEHLEELQGLDSAGQLVLQSVLKVSALFSTVLSKVSLFVLALVFTTVILIVVYLVYQQLPSSAEVTGVTGGHTPA
jgi:hypothetical protein